MASRDGLGLSRRRRLLRRGVLGTPRARRLAHEARRVHQDLAPPLVRPEAEQGLLVQGIDGHPRLQATWRYPGGQLPHRQGRRRRAPSPIHIRVVDLDRDDVLHRQFGEGEGGLDQFYWEIYCSALQVGKHGIIIEFADPDYNTRRSATYLPEVAAHEGWTTIEAIDSLVRKAGYISNHRELKGHEQLGMPSKY